MQWRCLIIAFTQSIEKSFSNVCTPVRGTFRQVDISLGVLNSKQGCNMDELIKKNNKLRIKIKMWISFTPLHQLLFGGKDEAWLAIPKNDGCTSSTSMNMTLRVRTGSPQARWTGVNTVVKPGADGYDITFLKFLFKVTIAWDSR